MGLEQEQATPEVKSGVAPIITAQPDPIVPAVAPAAITPAPSKVLGHGGEIPSERISSIKAAERQAAQTKLLLQHYGTSDPKEVERIKADRDAKLKEYETLKTEAEQRRLDQLSESDRLKEQLAKVEADKAKIEAELTTLKTTSVVNSQTQVLNRVAEQFINPKYTKFALVEFQEHVTSLSTAEVDALKSSDINKWFKNYAKENPEMGKKVDEPVVEKTETTTAKPVTRKPMTTSNTPKGGKPVEKVKPSTDPSLFNGKTPRPGQPNSMNAKELAAYKKAMKVSW